ncbi:MAG: hypothetical protein ACRYFX_11290 [Janthinobacterium lividum]
MAKKNTSEADATATKRTPQEKAQRKADKASQRATQTLTDSHAEKKAGQKKTLKSAAKQLQKELDTRMSEMVASIRKETKAKLKEVVKEATRRLDVDTERMFEQALHTIVRHYDSIAPGRDHAITMPAPGATASDDADTAAPTTGRGRKKNQTLNKDGSPRKTRTPKATTADEAPAAPAKRTGRSVTAGRKKAAPAAATATPATSTGRKGPGRPKRQPADLSTPEAATNDSAATDNE